jgi:adenylate cyclase
MIVLFADVSGSARLFERLGDTEASYAVERCVKRMERSIAGQGGQTVKVSGGELLATFESAEEACHAAVNMQLRVSKLPPVSGLKLTIRIGLHVAALDADAKSPTEDSIALAKRLAAMARIDQILASSLLIGEFPRHTSILSRPKPELGQVEQGETSLDLVEIDWLSHEDNQRKFGVTIDPTPSQFLADVDRLCVRYHGNAFLLDEKSPYLTLGRDPASKLLIVDRKASRAHARIERRNNSYVYIDSSTNGSYVSVGGQNEVMVRRREIELKGSGRICFGGSASDPKADFAEFEHL